MKILWLCNIVLPELSDIFGFKKQNVGGWLTGAWTQLKKQSEIDIAICVPIRNPNRMIDGIYDGYRFYSFLTISAESNTDIEIQIARFSAIINDFCPNIIHIWGTEFEHSYSMVKACEQQNMLSHVIVSVQGLMSYCERIYTLGIPNNMVVEKVNGKSLNDEKKDFKERAVYEKLLFKKIKNVAGRTDWDKACSKELNENINYFSCGAILRNIFYSAPKWNEEKCKRHTIFMSQAFYPIKGLHLLLGEFHKLSKIYDDLEIVIAGNNLLMNEGAYSHYIKSLILKYDLKEQIKFLGLLDEEEMIEQYLNANVFLSSSLIENESNSICEAMILGVPVVSSFVGGVGSVVSHNKNGFLYPINESYLMTYYVRHIFDDSININEISKEAIRSAAKYNNVETITGEMIAIYETIR